MCPDIRVGSSHGFQGSWGAKPPEGMTGCTLIDIHPFLIVWLLFDFVLINFNNLIMDESINAIFNT